MVMVELGKMRRWCLQSLFPAWICWQETAAPGKSSRALLPVGRNASRSRSGSRPDVIVLRWRHEDEEKHQQPREGQKGRTGTGAPADGSGTSFAQREPVQRHTRFTRCGRTSGNPHRMQTGREPEHQQRDGAGDQGRGKRHPGGYPPHKPSRVESHDAPRRLD